MTVIIVVGIIAVAFIGVAILREGEWDAFKKNNVKQPKDDELPKEQ